MPKHKPRKPHNVQQVQTRTRTRAKILGVLVESTYPYILYSPSQGLRAQMTTHPPALKALDRLTKSDSQHGRPQDTAIYQAAADAAWIRVQ